MILELLRDYYKSGYMGNFHYLNILKQLKAIDSRIDNFWYIKSTDTIQVTDHGDFVIISFRLGPN